MLGKFFLIFYWLFLFLNGERIEVKFEQYSDSVPKMTAHKVPSYMY